MAKHTKIKRPETARGRKRGIFKVVKFTNPSGDTAYRVTGTKLDGTRIRENLPNDIEARVRVEQLEIEARNDQIDEVYRRTWLSTEQIREAETAFQRIGDGATLQIVIDHYLATFREPVSDITFKDALDQFLQSKKDSNARPLTVRNLRVRLSGLLQVLPAEVRLSEIPSSDIQARIHRSGLAPSTRDNERRAYRAFFRWAKRQGLVSDDPTDAIDPIRDDQKEPEFMTLDEVRGLLDAAQQYKDGTLLPYTALCLFGALRPTEAQRLGWADIDFAEGVITIKGAHAKLRKRRRVHMSDNLIAWLEPYRLSKGQVTPQKNYRRNFDIIKQRSGWRGDRQGKNATGRKWIPDIMRHTAITYHYAAHRHEGETATWAGTSPTILHTNYRGLASEADAKSFWLIAPPKKGPIPGRFKKQKAS